MTAAGAKYSTMQLARIGAIEVAEDQLRLTKVKNHTFGSCRDARDPSYCGDCSTQLEMRVQAILAEVEALKK